MQTESADMTAARKRAELFDALEERPCVVLDLVSDPAEVMFGTQAHAAKEATAPLRFPLMLHPPVAFKKALPTALELELAIEAVETVVVPLTKHIQTDSQLFVRSSALDLLWDDQDAHSKPLPIDLVEAAFLDLAAVAEGRPATSSGFPLEAEFTMQLLFLREAMHHLGFTQAHLASKFLEGDATSQ